MNPANAAQGHTPSVQAMQWTRLMRNENGRRLLAREDFMTEEEIAGFFDQAIAAETARLRASNEALCADKERLDWLIKQGPPGAAEGMGLNDETWSLACALDAMDVDDKAVRAAIDQARANGGKP